MGEPVGKALDPVDPVFQDSNVETGRAAAALDGQLMLDIGI